MRMRWVGNVAPRGEKRNAYRNMAKELEGKRPLGRPRSRWRVLERQDEAVRSGSSESGRGPALGFCEQGNEHSVPSDVGKFLSSCASPRWRNCSRLQKVAKQAVSQFYYITHSPGNKLKEVKLNHGSNLRSQQVLWVFLFHALFHVQNMFRPWSKAIFRWYYIKQNI
jgi:hypothetical protein